ncbi:lysophospholipid acyltransferase LPEAT1 isoform X1 [Senna tora]|uniref:Lysophospholipid acyltransferase LPEAT1 isoform X1 n=1 Tax=Senna tora TaxID=362788 RepID=A0A834U035_9FABA|nr:lysophospholipid acyltransferase LPEAT1 isoform X1 [Senna tora]
METELKDLNSNPPKFNSSADTDPVHDSDPTSHVSSDHLEDLEKKFAAYVRCDVYGVMGRGELPTKEKVLLGLALVTLVPIRVVFGMAILVFYYLICKICTLCYAPNREEEQEDYAHMSGWRRAVIVQSGRTVSRMMLFVLGFYWIRETSRSSNTDDKSTSRFSVLLYILVLTISSFFFQCEKEGKHQSEEMGPPGVIISNHVSYLDILYHMSSSFPSFVAKRSVAKLPLVGLISKCLGCVYVQRESKSSDFKGVSGVVTDRIREAHQNKSAPIMMLFPEGTTTNGDFLLPFKTGGFLARAPVLPVILRYPYQRFSPAWDSISGVRHVILLLCQFVNYMEVTRLPVYYPSQQEKDDPKLYANNVRRLMASEGNLILSDIGLAEKRIYHAALNGNNSLPSVMHQKDD